MSTRQLLKPLFTTILFVVVIAAAIFPKSSVSAKFANGFDPSMGDVQRFDGEGYSPTFGTATASDNYVGMGDLQLFNAESLIHVSGHLIFGYHYVGMGDLQLYQGNGVILPVAQLAAAF